MSKIYTVWGDYGYVDETELFTSTSEKEAIEWAKNYVIDWDLCDFDLVEVAYHATDGEYVTVYSFGSADFADTENLVDEW